jgi:hypothetical protein
MASTYSNLKIELIGTGEQSGTWGNTTNTNLGTAIEEAITGSVNVSFSNADVTLTLANANTSQTARNLRLNLTGSASGPLNLNIPDVSSGGAAFEKFYIISNTLSYEVVVKNTTGTTYTVPAGTTAQVFCTGTGIKSGISFFEGEVLSSAAYILGGAIENTPIGSITPSTIEATTIQATGLTVTGTATLATVDINAGTIDGTTISSSRINSRAVAAASASSLTPDVATYDQYAYTALATGLTINAPTGTPLDGQELTFRFLDNGVSQTLTWNATYTEVGAILPLTTGVSKTIYVGCIYNAYNTRWDVVAVAYQS